MFALQVRLLQTAPIPLDAEFVCEAGEMLALVGPSGSGKTTILRTIAGLARCENAFVCCGGTVWTDTANSIALSLQSRRVGLVFQSYALFPHLTALENIALACRRDDRTSRARALLARVRLDGLDDRRPAQLSGGQQQRVALARALAREPQVLLLDEPFAAVDQVTRQDLYVELAQLRRSLSMPIVLVTHDLSEAQRLADTIVILDAGTTLQTGTPQHVLRRPRNARVAKLLGLHNHFDGVFHRSGEDQHWSELTWGTSSDGVHLPVIDKHRIEDGARVTWTIPGDCLSISAQPDPLRLQYECALKAAVALGDVTQCTVKLFAPPHAEVVVTAPSRLLPAIGDRLFLSIEPEEIHIMPVQHRAQSVSASAKSV